MNVSKLVKLPIIAARCKKQIRTKCYLSTIQPIKTATPMSVKSFSTADNNTAADNSWRAYVRKWQWKISFGLGISLLAVLQWRYFRRKNDINKGPIQGLMLECYCSLPLRITSRVWGGVANLELPVYLRSTIYTFYAKLFKANLDEIDASLTDFPSLADFFVRPLKPNARLVAKHVNLVSPADGKILHFGPVTSCKVEQVKGMTYNLQHFLGESIGQRDSSNIKSSIICDDYVLTLLKNPDNVLYQMTIYLAPGDYHRFHSPTDWRIYQRRHFQGKLLSVNPRVASWLPDLFSINERVVYIGDWAGGFMAFAAVGATNVGSIRVYKDENLVTNTRKWPRGKNSEDAEFGNGMVVNKGELFGEFRMGSTIVMLFEASKDFEFSVDIGQKIKFGQGLTNETSNRSRVR